MLRPYRIHPLLLSLVATLLLWIGSKWYFGDWFSDPYKYVAKTASLSATILFCWSMILSARLRWVSDLFGGLDKAYHAHAICGGGGFLLVLLHPLFLSLHRLPSIFGIFDFLWFQPFFSLYQIGHNLGIISLIILFILLGISGYKKIPYNIWKRTHNFMSLWFVLVIIHILLVDADIAAYPLLKIWMYSWLGFSLWCGIYMRFVYPLFGCRYEYAVKDIEVFEQSAEIWLKPCGKVLRFDPGQYIFVKFLTPFFSKECHPFSIACSEQPDGSIKLGIKNLGDYTNKIQELSIGTKSFLYGPYGNISQILKQKPRDCVFIGGGVGITPFLGMWESIVSQKNSPKTTLIYSVKSQQDATFDNDIQKSIIHAKFIKTFSDSCQYVLHDVSKKGYLNADIVHSLHPNIAQSYIFLCGPKSMTDSLIAGFIELGVQKSQIILEEFEMRLGYRDMFDKLKSKF
jgi:predicted ferric reductase